MRLPNPILTYLFGSRPARRTILGLWAAATVAGLAVGGLRFRIDNSVGVWFAKDDPALAEYRQFLDDFGHREWTTVVVEQRTGTPERQALDRRGFAARLALLNNVHRVLSSAEFPLGSPFVRKFLKPDPRSPSEALLVQVTNDIDRQDGYREDLVAAIRRLAARYRTIDQVHVAGTAVINGELNHAARRDMFLFVPLVALLVGVLGAAIFRNARDTVVLLGVALGTVVITEGLLLAVGYPLNMITIMLPTVLIALSVADAVHLIQVFHDIRPDAGDDGAAARRAVKAVAWPCAGTSLTTIAGFLAFSRSSVVPVYQMAVFGAFGIALAWVLTMAAAPALLVALWRGAIRTQLPAARVGDRLLSGWWRVADRHPAAIVFPFVVAGAALIGLVSLRADTDYVKFFRSSTRVPRDYRVLQREGFPQNPLNLVLRFPSATSPLTPEYRPALESFVGELETLPGVHAVFSPFLMAGLTVGLGDQAQTLGGLLSKDGGALQLIVMMDHPSSRRLFALLPRIEAAAQRILPGDVHLVPTGTSWLWARMDDGVIETQRQSLLIVCVVCFVILALLFRSPWLAALGLGVSFYPVAIVLGLMGLWHIPVNLATVLIAGIAVGLAVDDTIHFVHAFQARRRNGERREVACEHALAEVGLRMVMTSLILVGGFAIMGLSDFLPTAQFGLLSSLTIVLALAADLFLVPVLLSWRRRRPGLVSRESTAAGDEGMATAARATAGRLP